MFQFRYCCALILWCGIIGVAAPAIAKERKQHYEVSVFTDYATLPANNTAIAKTRIEIAAAFPAWAATTDKLNGMFTDIYGQPVALPGSGNKEKADYCMTHQLHDLEVSPADWQLIKEVKAPKADYVNYTQVVSGHPVVFSRLSFRFTKAGTLARIQMKNYGTPAPGLAPAIGKEAAMAAAMRNLDGIAITAHIIEPEWSWFPVPVNGGYLLHPAWKFVVKGKMSNKLPCLLHGYVDAINGRVLYRTNEVRETSYDLTVKGNVYKHGTLNPATDEPLTDLNLGIGAGTYATDSAGRYRDLSLSLPLSTDLPLSGKWCTVFDNAGLTPSFTIMVSTAGTYTYPATLPSSSRHVNAYYHTTRVHNYMKQFFPAITLLDISLETNVDVPGECNAYFTGTSINFFEAGGGCNSFAEMADVVYHEYGHAINAAVYQELSGMGMGNRALDEGYADVWAMSMTHDPVMGKNAFVGFGGYIRRYDVTPQVYPIDVDASGFGDPHKIGQIIAGCWWDAGINLGSIDSMTKLFTAVYYDCADGGWGMEGVVFQTILIDALMADDNDANILNGTPHYEQIVSAFAKHGIYIEGDATLIHTELPMQTAGVPIAVAADLELTDAARFKDLTLYYRVNAAGPWLPVVLSNSSFTFFGVIPTQLPGTTVEYYFVAHDLLNVANAYFPITCNPSMPSTQTTIPYQFGVGLDVKEATNFESSSPGYSIGSNSGDDAAPITWQLKYPSIFNDHTTGTGKCVVVEDAGFIGTSSVLTPIFDISGFTTPVVEYYRLFSNEQGYDNFKNDPWIVKLRDATGSTWQTLEQTYQCDIAWRRRIVPVRAFLPATTTQIQLKFFVSDSLLLSSVARGQSKIYAGIDDIYIYDGSKRTGTSDLGHSRTKIYPVPADTHLEVDLVPTYGVTTISLWDMTGKKVYEREVEANVGACSIVTGGLAAGVYNLMIQSAGTAELKKVTIIHR